MRKLVIIVICFLLVGFTGVIDKQMAFAQDRVVDDLGNGLFKIRANPSRGYNYDYYLSIPNNFGDSSIHRLLVSPTNSSSPNDSMKYHDERTYADITTGWKSALARRLGVPHLMPVFPRTSKHFTHILNRDIVFHKNGEMAHLDRQLITMIGDARSFLLSKDINIKEKVYMNGFSACGKFSNRFTMLHPNIVRAVASGGMGGQPILPLDKYENRNLHYPVGTYDIIEITGSPFDRASYFSVAQYIYMGEIDYNDATMYRDAYSEFERDLVWTVLGRNMGERWKKAQALYRELGIPAKMVTYEGIGHQVKSKIMDDLVAFFKANDL